MEYFAFQWHITDSCDQRCLHCYIFSENNHFKLKEMSWDEIESVLQNCQDMCSKANRVPYFYITGGDPILHSRFWDLMELFKSNKIAFSILGNPFHLNDEVCQRLKACGCERYQLSIDGLRETHDAIRMPGSFDTTLEKIKCLRNAGIRCAIMTTVSGTNIAEMPEIVDLVVEHKADIFAFARYCPNQFRKKHSPFARTVPRFTGCIVAKIRTLQGQWHQFQPEGSPLGHFTYTKKDCLPFLKI